MTVKDLMDEYIIPELTIICIEDLSGNCKYCGPRCDYKPKRDYKIRNIFPAIYDAHCEKRGITILVDC